MAHDVFISYSFRDKHVADAVCNGLESNRIKCWIAPRDIMPGKEWGEEIVEAISQSKVMVLIFSSAANNSQQVLREVERAVGKNVIIVPFRIENVLPTKSMEYFLYSTHWLDAVTPDLEKHIGELVETVGKFVMSETPSSAGSGNSPDKQRKKVKKRRRLFAAASLGAIFLIGLGILVRFGKTQLKTGDYLEFGSYYGEPVIWRVIDIDEDRRPLLLTSQIISLKPFDAAESGIYNQTKNKREFNREDTEDYSPAEFREMKGSNNWADSNLRAWLNSADRRVKFTGAPPAAAGLWRGRNAYEDEPGFLSFFSERERGLIQPVSHKALLSEIDKDASDGGLELFIPDHNEVFREIDGYDRAFYQTVEDRVFLLSVKEVNTYLRERGWRYWTGVTAEAVERDESNWYYELRGKAGGDFMWWLRTPVVSSACDVYIVNEKGDIMQGYASQIGVGLRPALYLKASRHFMSGTGREGDPYRLKK